MFLETLDKIESLRNGDLGEGFLEQLVQFIVRPPRDREELIGVAEAFLLERSVHEREVMLKVR